MIFCLEDNISVSSLADRILFCLEDKLINVSKLSGYSAWKMSIVCQEMLLGRLYK